MLGSSHPNGQNFHSTGEKGLFSAYKSRNIKFPLIGGPFAMEVHSPDSNRHLSVSLCIAFHDHIICIYFNENSHCLIWKLFMVCEMKIDNT